MVVRGGRATRAGGAGAGRGDGWGVGWDEEEAPGRSRRRGAAADVAWESIGLSVASLLLGLAAAVAWVLVTWLWPLLLAVAVLTALMGALALVLLRRHRVRHLGALVLGVVAAATGAGTVVLMAEQVLLALLL
ncbi:hypothetical protein [uncultured Pseudokineococcus sp.]|uniref:hypothetical protein n=1 Tax=uncultured Pseudokineococcus sp. TaxID=1642928 RepID=UPI00260CB278|nr:hypothetical protein [uncultured Pseudokineococcus sp.]